MGVFRTVFKFSLVALTAALASSNLAVAGDAPVTIIDLGDSYITGYGIGPSKAFAAVLQETLKSRGHSVEVINTGFKSKSSSGLDWLLEPDGQKLLAAPEGHAVILELGQNDCNRFEVDETRANLDQIVSQLAMKHIPVLIVGTEPYPICSSGNRASYPNTYRQIFPDLAKKYGVIFYRDFKDGISEHPELLQADKDHPNAAGEAIIVEKILPSVEALIAQVGE